MYTKGKRGSLEDMNEGDHGLKESSFFISLKGDPKYREETLKTFGLHCKASVQILFCTLAERRHFIGVLFLSAREVSFNDLWHHQGWHGI